VPLRVAIPDMVSPSYFPAIAAVELGFFKREGLDASIELLFPVTKTFEALRDGQIDFVGGARGVRALEQLVDGGHAAVAFSMFPVSVVDLMAVADAGEIMPPKSTWFEPKLADGMVSHVLD